MTATGIASTSRDQVGSEDTPPLLDNGSALTETTPVETTESPAPLDSWPARDDLVARMVGGVAECEPLHRSTAGSNTAIQNTGVVCDEQRVTDFVAPTTQSLVSPTMPLHPPRPFYGWWMLLFAMSFAIATSPGQTFGVSIFNEPMRIELGLTQGQLALAYMLGTLMGAIPITWFGRQVDRHGLRRSTMMVIVAFAAACLSVTGVVNWFTLVLSFTLLRMLGPGALSLMSANILPFWFHRRLGSVEGYRQTAMAVAMAIIPSINLWLVFQVGWRGAYALMATAVLALLPITWLFFRNRPKDVGQRIDGRTEARRSVAGVEMDDEEGGSFTLRQALRTAVFWSALANGALYSLIHTGVFFCLVPILQEQDLDVSYSAWMLMVFAISLASNQLLGGWLADRVAPAKQMFAGQMLFGLGLILLYRGGSASSVLLAGSILGAAQGLFFAASNPIWARYFGLTHLGSIRGFLMSFHVAFSSVGPLMVGWCHDLFGNFEPILFTFAMLPLALAVGLRWVQAPPPPATT